MTATGIPTPSARLRSALTTETGHKALASIARYFHATLEQKQHLPRQGPGLIVSNHALLALDSIVLGALIVRDLGRFPRFLADRMLWKVPGLQQVLCAIGALPGDPQAAVQLLRAGELVIVYPGGVDDSLKSSRERYRLQWKNRAGFARVAMTAGVPILPVVGLGIDEMYRVFGREHFLGRRIFGSPRYDLPLAVGAFGTWLPKRATQRYIALPPIDTRGDPERREDVERVRNATFDALEAQLRVARGE
ncbi:MAG TPA: lysophospholipid acyltransferase family protein [Polyangiales bacterium]|nr:lysophospholipid acyltransferase family protein [Polyangiales bacterium]